MLLKRMIFSFLHLLSVYPCLPLIVVFFYLSISPLLLVFSSFSFLFFSVLALFLFAFLSSFPLFALFSLTSFTLLCPSVSSQSISLLLVFDVTDAGQFSSLSIRVLQPDKNKFITVWIIYFLNEEQVDYEKRKGRAEEKRPVCELGLC